MAIRPPDNYSNTDRSTVGKSAIVAGLIAAVAAATGGLALPLIIVVAVGGLLVGAAGGAFFSNRSVEKVDPKAPHDPGSPGHVASRSHSSGLKVLSDSPESSGRSSPEGPSSPDSIRTPSLGPLSPVEQASIDDYPLSIVRKGELHQKYSDLHLDRGFARDVDEIVKETAREVSITITNGDHTKHLNKKVHENKVNEAEPLWEKVDQQSIRNCQAKTVLDAFDEGFLEVTEEGPRELPFKEKAASMSSQEFLKQLGEKWFPSREDAFFKVELETISIDAKTGDYKARGTAFFQNPTFEALQMGLKVRSDNYTLEVDSNLNTDTITGRMSFKSEYIPPPPDIDDED